ncbi:protein kinase [Hyalangium sp. s54d21]|uniref:Protein kinase n=1 Tax=Hyalangium rubrum TaxID=3103134 RepID=A0ABU5GW62_9BACT|nr:protein kinase [Hyalangium sp. s54d21]MDY7225286.1 protein kinase [Hyalangium sp. s54d21]
MGGMAELFLAQQPPKPDLVVLKRILPYLSEEPEFVQMFLDEAKIAAQLHHPNIVQVYELGKLDNTIFIAMEFVEGIDLRRVVQEEQKFNATVPYGVAAAICAQVSAGLDYAHAACAVDGRPLDLIHRDISPQNVMIAYDGRVKLVDFGIAKAGAFIEARSKPGVIKGKFLYLSPEQVSQKTLDHRADIFALGTMMYEITTGKSPFAKPTTEGILYAIRSEDPSPPHLLRDDYPTELSRIIMRCLVKDRELRYQRAGEVQEDLEAFLASGIIRQSTDISDYVARLMGEEEERTVLHIPIAAPAGRKDATLPMPAGRREGTAPMAAGLTARPMRRPTGEGVAAPPDYGAEPEPPTQMARPRELPASQTRPPASRDAVEEIRQELEEEFSEEDTGAEPARGREDFEDDAEESTAVGTIPVGFHRPEPGESTVQERGPRRAPPASSVADTLPPPRRSGPGLDRDTEPRGRRPATPPSRQALVEDEEDGAQSISLTQPTLNQRLRHDDDEGSQSVSLTPATVNQRPASRQYAKPAPEEDSVVDTESGLGEGEHTDAAHGYDEDVEDDESTAGYESDLETPAPRNNRGLLLAVAAVVLLLVLGGGLFWALNSGTSDMVEGDGPPPAVPFAPPQPGTPTDTAQGSAPQPEPAPPEAAAPPVAEVAPSAGTGEEGTAAPGTEAALANPTGAPEGTETGTAMGAAVAATGTPVPTEGTGANPDPIPEPPKGVQVKFKTSSTTAVVQVNGKKVEANKVLTLPPGSIRVVFVCSSNRRPNKGSFVKTLKEGVKGLQEFSIPCKKGQR